jgi:hypothetical protein
LPSCTPSSAQAPGSSSSIATARPQADGRLCLVHHPDHCARPILERAGPCRGAGRERGHRVSGDDSGLSRAAGGPIHRVRRSLLPVRGREHYPTIRAQNYAVVAEPAGGRRCARSCRARPTTRCGGWTMLALVASSRRSGPSRHPPPGAPVAVHTRRLRQAYPIYTRGYEGPFGILDQWAESLPRLLTYGRQGLFAHDNTHHALYMARAAVDCLEPLGLTRKSGRSIGRSLPPT